jgi:polysaccharide pyruvyl transferase WcaK-like protein
MLFSLTKLISSRIKPSVTFGLGKVYASTRKWQRQVYPGGSTIGSVAILPPGDAGSLGDEAMVMATIDYFKSLGVSKIGIFSYSSTPCCVEAHPDIEVLRFGSILNFATVVSRYDAFLCLGADMLDGYYKEKTSLTRIQRTLIAAKTGAKSCILGFSFNENPKPSIIKALNALPPEIRLCARDPVSHGRLVSYLNRPVDLVADLAFLLSPAEHSDIACQTLNWIDIQKQQGRLIVGLNANYQMVKHLGLVDSQKVIEFYVQTISSLFQKEQKTSFVLVSHDFRNASGQPSDLEFSSQIWEKLSPEIKPYCFKVPDPCQAAEIKAMVKTLDVMISGRMHLAIACLGQGVPTACLTYQGKFEGLFKHFGIDGLTIDPAHALQRGNLDDVMEPIIKNRHELRQRICAKLPDIRQLSQANFKEINPC